MERDRTTNEQDYRYLAATLDGHPDPAKYALCFSVNGSTLHIDATRGVEGV